MDGAAISDVEVDRGQLGRDTRAVRALHWLRADLHRADNTGERFDLASAYARRFVPELRTVLAGFEEARRAAAVA